MHGRKELELGKAILLRHHDFAASGHTGQERQAHIATSLAHGTGVAGADREAGTGPRRRLGVGLGAHGTGAHHGFGDFAGNGFNTSQRLGRTQRDLQHANPTRHQGTCHVYGVGDIIAHDDGDDRSVLHHLQCS